MAISERDPLAPALARLLSRREVLGAASAAGLTAAVAVVGRAPAPAWAQDATPQATPVASPATGGTAARFAYVGTYTREAPGGGGTAPAIGISVFSIDPVSGALSLLQSVPSDNPSFLALDQTQRFLYAINEVDDYEGRTTGSVEAYAIDAGGTLSLLNRQDSGGAIPAHLAVDPSGRYLVIGNYIGATFTVLPIRAEGTLEPVRGTVTQSGSGPNAERQEAPHPHAVNFDPAGRFIATADLGIDRVQVFRLDTAVGQLMPVSEVSMTPGAGPRHLAFHPDGRFLYVINELNATVTVLPYDAAIGALGGEIQTIPTVPDDFADQRSTAEIAIHPSGRFLYGSNRGYPNAVSPVADSVVAYAIDQGSGKLSLIGHATEGMDFPRSFGIDPTGTRLYACNQQGDTIVQFDIDRATGVLVPTGEVTSTPTPVCIVFKHA